MYKYKRYTGSFAKYGVVWRVEIWQDNWWPWESMPSMSGELDFPADDPLLIEWMEKEVYEPVQGSTATLTIISPSDRKYIDLYTVEPGTVQLRVYRNDSLYWLGSLDPEFYEEPYERADNYDVSLKFSDFGILDRIRWEDAADTPTKLSDVVARCLAAARLDDVDVVERVSTSLADEVLTLDNLCVRASNFIDEDDKGETLLDTLAGVLQPLSLRIIQLNGHIYIYDLNALYQAAQSAAAEIEWDGDSQTLSAGEVAKSATVRFSPYATNGEIIPNNLKFTGETSERTNLGCYAPSPSLGEYYSFMPRYKVGDEMVDGNDIDFTIFLGTGDGLAYTHSANNFFRIKKVLGSAEEGEGYAYDFIAGAGRIDDENQTKPVRGVTGSLINPRDGRAPIMRTQRAFLPALPPGQRYKVALRLKLPILVDVRYDPWGADDDGNDKEAYDTAKHYAGYVFVPVVVRLYDEAGNVIAHATNYDRVTAGVRGHISLRSKWEEGDVATNSTPVMWLQYYDPNDMENGCAIGGWKTNRQSFGRPENDTLDIDDNFIKKYRRKNPEYLRTESFTKIGEGEYIEYPTQGGYIEVEILKGIKMFDQYDSSESPMDGTNAGKFTQGKKADKVMEKIRWLLYKAPTIDVVNSLPPMNDLESEDIEYTGYCNKSAAEEVQIDTICGSTNKPMPSAKGLLLTSDYTPIDRLTRAGKTDAPERLLIGTIISQMSERRTALSGEAKIHPYGLTAFTERAQPSDRYFIMRGQQQNIIESTSNISVVELRPETYTIEEVND